MEEKFHTSEWQCTGTFGEDVITQLFTNGTGGTKEEITFPGGDKQSTVYENGQLVETVLSFADGRVTTVFGNGGLRIVDTNEGTLIDLPTAEDVANWHAQIGGGESLFRPADEVAGSAFDEITANYDSTGSDGSHDPGSGER